MDTYSATPLQLSLDQQLKPIIEGLQERYHVGSCPEHPTIRCSWNPGTEASWHIQLDDRRLNVWAHSIVRDKPYLFELLEDPQTSILASETCGVQSHPYWTCFLPAQGSIAPFRL